MTHVKNSDLLHKELHEKKRKKGKKKSQPQILKTLCMHWSYGRLM